MIADLRYDGIVGVAPMRGTEEMLAYLKTRPTYHGHVKGASVAVHQPGNSTCWAPEDVLAAPHFFEFAMSVLPLVKEYLGPHPLLYSVNAFTTYPIMGPMNPDIQAWHRDRDDEKFLALFVYLTDVNLAADGAHLFQRGTQRCKANGGEVQEVTGAAGTAFLADTSGLHMGIRPALYPRTLAWARWCISDPPASYRWDKQQPCSRDVLGARYPTDVVLQDLLRLVVQ